MTMDDAQALVDDRDELAKLLKNKIFKKFIGEGYFKTEAARLANASTNPEMMDEIDQREIFSMLKGIGHLQNFILEVKRKGDNAERAIKEELERQLEEERRSNIEIEIDPITGDEIEVKDD